MGQRIAKVLSFNRCTYTEANGETASQFFVPGLSTTPKQACPLDRSVFAQTLESDAFLILADEKRILDIDVGRILHQSLVPVSSDPESLVTPNVNLAECDSTTQANFLRELARYHYAKFCVTIPEIQKQSSFFKTAQEVESQAMQTDLNAVLEFLVERFQFLHSDFVKEEHHKFKDLVLQWIRR
mmetsp:Transcript_4144/g.6432  ORF Transcript_4144/g.6432 Transcript_4144/m.6432 type:complete len:184 (+) Transcript_4144:96-647(+)